MSEEQKDQNQPTQHSRRGKRHGFFFGLVAGGLFGALAAGAIATAASPAGALFKHGHRMGRHGGLNDPELARERANMAASFILNRVDGTEAQQAEVERIVSAAIDGLIPLAEEHRSNREVMHSILSATEIDPQAIEDLRRSQLELADRASLELSRALTEFAQTLTAEQRAELLAMAERFHR